MNDFTKRQRDQSLRWKEFVSSYHKRLLSLVNEFLACEGLEVHGGDGSFVFIVDGDYLGSTMLPIELPDTMCEHIIQSFDSATKMLHMQIEEIAEAEKLKHIQQVALAKLTKEEKIALGLEQEDEGW